MCKMKFGFKKLSKEKLSLVNKRWPEVSGYISESEIKDIAYKLDIAKDITKFAILNSLETIRFYSQDQDDHWKAERLFLWLMTLETCLYESDPLERWKQCRKAIIDTLDRGFNDPVLSAFEIIRDPKQPFDIDVIQISGLENYLAIPVLIISIVECCLQTVTLFNVNDLSAPSDVFYWGPDEPNFCEWRFRRRGSIFKVELVNGHVIERYAPGSQPRTKKDWDAYVRKYFPEYKKSQIKKITASSLPYWTSDNWLLDSHRLRVDLGESYLELLSNKERAEVLKRLVAMLGFAPFMYKPVHNVLAGWRKERTYEDIQAVLKTLEQKYSQRSIRRQSTTREYAILCYRLLKTILEEKTPVVKAAEILHQRFKKGIWRKVSGSRSIHQIRTRAYEVIKEESKTRRFNLKSEKDLEDLLDRIKYKYSIQDSELV